MYLIVGIWGSRERKIRAAYFFFFYTLLGSVLMLLSILYIYYQVGTTDYEVLMTFSFSDSEQKVLWLSFFASFATKIPMIPVHLWLSEAHVEAPTAGFVILAGLKKKMKNLVELCNPCFFNKQLNSKTTSIFMMSVLIINCLGVDHVAFCEPNFSMVPPDLIDCVRTWYNANLHHVYQNLALNQINGSPRNFGGILFYSKNVFDYYDGETIKNFSLTYAIESYPSVFAHDLTIDGVTYRINSQVRELVDSLVRLLGVLDLRLADTELEAIQVLMHFAENGQQSPFQTTDLILGWIEALVQAEDVDLPAVLGSLQTEFQHHMLDTTHENEDLILWYKLLDSTACQARNRLIEWDGNPQDS